MFFFEFVNPFFWSSMLFFLDNISVGRGVMEPRCAECRTFAPARVRFSSGANFLFFLFCFDIGFI